MDSSLKSRRKILFVDFLGNIDYFHACGAGLGSSLFKLAAMAEASENGYEVHLLTSPAKEELLSDSRGVDNVYTESSRPNYSSYFKIISLGIPADQLKEKFESFVSYCPFEPAYVDKYKTTPHLNFWRQLTASHLGYEVSSEQSEIELCLDTEDILTAARLMNKEFKWIAVSYQVISRLKKYPGWDEVINGLLKSDSRFRIILLGENKMAYPQSEFILNMMGNTSIQLLKAVISRADAVVGNDSLTTNLAIALKKPAVILFSMISPEAVIDDLHSEKTVPLIAPGCPYQFCYKGLINYRSSQCRYLEENSMENHPLCLKFDPDEIVKSTIELLN